MSRVAIFYCKRIKDHTCIACAKCFKGAAERAGEFAAHFEKAYGQKGIEAQVAAACPGR